MFTGWPIRTGNARTKKAFTPIASTEKNSTGFRGFQRFQPKQEMSSTWTLFQ